MTATQTKNTYRATIILDLRGSDESVENVIARLKKTFESVEGKVTADASLGQKGFVRVTDRKNPNGIYIQISVEGPGTIPTAFREKLRLDRSIKRILIQSV